MNSKIRYELSELEELLIKTNLSSTINTQLNNNVKDETTRIKQAILNEVFSFGNEQQLERYIQCHQQSLIRLMNDTINACNDLSLTKNKGRDSFYKECYGCLEELLLFLESQFPRYFDLEVTIPKESLARIRNDARASVKKIQKALIDHNANPSVVDLALSISKEMIDPDQPVTYRKLAFHREMQKQLLLLIENHTHKHDIDDELRQTMLSLNFNSSKAIRYFKSHVNSLAASVETRIEKIETLSFLLKKLNQTHVKQGIRYSLKTPSLKCHISNYIAEEIEYLERLRHLSSSLSSSSPNQGSGNFKLKLEISVSQLALLVKILVESKIVRNNNLSEVLNFLAMHIVTKRSETISFGSLRSKYYNVESGTIESVRTMLNTMIRNLDKS